MAGLLAVHLVLGEPQNGPAQERGGVVLADVVAVATQGRVSGLRVPTTAGCDDPLDLDREP